MARGRRRRKVSIKVGPVSGGYEWLGFRDAGIAANLDTNTAFELVPPAAAGDIGTLQMTVLRVVGHIELRKQSGVVSYDPVGLVLLASPVGRDQTVDEVVEPLSTDVDEFSVRDIMWWRNTGGIAACPIADADIVPLIIPVDIKVKRILTKRTRLFLNVTCATTGRMRASCCLRVLVKHSS